VRPRSPPLIFKNQEVTDVAEEKKPKLAQEAMRESLKRSVREQRSLPTTPPRVKESLRGIEKSLGK
jgi:hypothetical protein